MHARQVFRYRAVQGGVTVEMVVWALPAPFTDRTHGLKYRLYCGRGRTCLVRYDNEAGKATTGTTEIAKKPTVSSRSRSCSARSAKIAPAWRDGDGNEPNRD